MAKTGRIVVCEGQNFEIREYPVPDPAPDTILIKQELSGIWGTDLHKWQQKFDEETLYDRWAGQAP